VVPAAPALSEAPPSVHAALRSPGEPLDAATRAYFEPRFGRDFSGVRVHADAAAAQSARDVNAHAYTVGQNIAFDSGRFAPGSQAGRRLLAHELAHVAQQQAIRGQQIYRQGADSGLPIRIKIGDTTRLNKNFTWHFDTLPERLKNQLSNQVKASFSFLPKKYPVTVEWGQFKADDLKRAGNIQVWLLPEDSKELVDPVFSLYGYSKKAIKAALDDLTTIKENSWDKDENRETIGLVPEETADPKHDPMTGRPVIVVVPDEFFQEIDPVPEFKKAHPKATASRRIARLGYTTLHELGHILQAPHKEKGNIGAVSKETGNFQESFPPDIMDRVAPFFVKGFTDSPDIKLTHRELADLGGKETVLKNPIVTEVKENPETDGADVWIDVTKLGYSSEEQTAIQNNLNNLKLFVDSVNAAKKKGDK
jgi:uncharacterized protein DUF4157